MKKNYHKNKTKYNTTMIKKLCMLNKNNNKLQVQNNTIKK